MLHLNYFWYFLISQFFCEPLRQYAKSDLVGSNPTFKSLTMIVAPLVMTANIVFLILGFWFMPHWYYPLIFFAIDLLTIGLHVLFQNQNVKLIILLIGIIAAPLFSVFAYLGLFGVV